MPSIQKGVLPTHLRSNVIYIGYKYSCHCDNAYVGRTSRRLEERIRQLDPKSIRNSVKPQKDLKTSMQIDLKRTYFVNQLHIVLHAVHNTTRPQSRMTTRLQVTLRIFQLCRGKNP